MSNAQSSQLAEEDDDDDNSQDNLDDFGCVPVNNIDHETMHIKVIEDEPRFQQKSQLLAIDDGDHNTNNYNNGGY